MDLIRRIEEGDDEAEKEILAQYTDKIKLTICTKIGFNNPDCEDVLQEVLIAFLQNLREKKFDQSRETNLDSYILGITYNKLRGYFEAGKKQKKIELDSEAPLSALWEDETFLEKEEFKNALRDILKKLPLKYQEVLYLKFYQDLKVREISKQLDMPPRRISERIHYALQLYKKECKKTKLFSIFLPFLLIYIWSFLK